MCDKYIFLYICIHVHSQCEASYEKTRKIQTQSPYYFSKSDNKSNSHHVVIYSTLHTYKTTFNDKHVSYKPRIFERIKWCKKIPKIHAKSLNDVPTLVNFFLRHLYASRGPAGLFASLVPQAGQFEQSRAHRERGLHDQRARQAVHHRVPQAGRGQYGPRGDVQVARSQSTGWASHTYLYLCFMPQGCISQMGEWFPNIRPPLLWAKAVGTRRTTDASEEGVEVAHLQEIPQNGQGVPGRGSLPGNMPHNQPQVVPTFAIEGGSATACRRLFQRETREKCARKREKEGGGRDWGRRGPERERKPAKTHKKTENSEAYHYYWHICDLPLYLKMFGESQPFCENTDDIPFNSLGISRKWNICTKKWCFCRAHVGKER